MNSVVEPEQTPFIISNSFHSRYENVPLKALIGRMKSISTLPTFSSKVMKELEDGDSWLGNVEGGR